MEEKSADQAVVSNSPALKYAIIIAICLNMATNFFYAFMNYSLELMRWFFENAVYVNLAHNALRLFLAVIFILFCYRKKYTALFYSLLAILVVVVIQNVRIYFSGPSLSVGNSGPNLMLLLLLVHACCIFFSEARTNRWLLIYAIAIVVSILLTGNLARMGYMIPVAIMTVAINVVPVVFIFLTIDEFRKAETGDVTDERDILDQ